MYNSHEIAKRIKSQCRQMGMPLGEMLSTCGLGINTISKISNGNDILTLNFAKIADCLDCSVDYLLGRSATPDRSGGYISPALSRLVDAAADLTDEEVEKAVEYVDFLRASRK